MDKEVCRLEQLLQDLSSTCSSLADKVGANAHARRVARGVALQPRGALLLCMAWWLSKPRVTCHAHLSVSLWSGQEPSRGKKHTQCGAFALPVSSASNASVCIASAFCTKPPRLPCTLAAVCGVHCAGCLFAKLPTCAAAAGGDQVSQNKQPAGRENSIGRQAAAGASSSPACSRQGASGAQQQCQHSTNMCCNST